MLNSKIKQILLLLVNKDFLYGASHIKYLQNGLQENNTYSKTPQSRKGHTITISKSSKIEKNFIMNPKMK